jgi:hypothetical protein
VKRPLAHGTRNRPGRQTRAPRWGHPASAEESTFKQKANIPIRKSIFQLKFEPLFCRISSAVKNRPAVMRFSEIQPRDVFAF